MKHSTLPYVEGRSCDVTAKRYRIYEPIFTHGRPRYIYNRKGRSDEPGG